MDMFRGPFFSLPQGAKVSYVPSSDQKDRRLCPEPSCLVNIFSWVILVLGGVRDNANLKLCPVFALLSISSILPYIWAWNCVVFSFSWSIFYFYLAKLKIWRRGIFQVEIWLILRNSWPIWMEMDSGKKFFQMYCKKIWYGNDILYICNTIFMKISSCFLIYNLVYLSAVDLL